MLKFCQKIVKFKLGTDEEVFWNKKINYWQPQKLILNMMSNVIMNILMMSMNNHIRLKTESARIHWFGSQIYCEALIRWTCSMD